MNACEANVVEALLHAGATRTTGTLLSRLAVPFHSRRGHGEDGVMVAPQSLGALAERPLLRTACRACMELRVSPARHGSGHTHATSSRDAGRSA